MVPNGWNVKSLVEVTKWSSGGTPSKSNILFWNGNIPWISAASMRGHYYSDSGVKITELAVSKGAKMAEACSLLLLVRGSMLWNKIPVGITTRKVAFNQDVKCLVPQQKEITPDFLLYWFLTHEHQLMNMVTGTGIGAGKLDTNDLQNLDIYLPPLPEQRKIAKILSTWDKAITTTEKLIESSKQQKKSLMQQLLTGKKRLVNSNTGERFEGNWEENLLKNTCKMQAGKFVKANEIKEVDGMDMSPCYGGNGLRGFTKSYTHIGTYSLIGRQGALCGNINLANGKFHATEHAVVTTPIEGINTKWLYYMLIDLNLNQYATGQAQPGLSVKNLEQVTITFPTEYLEQQKIASVLTAADKEIEVLGGKLSHLKQEKKALMQQLLTGKRRVKVEKNRAE